MPTEEKHKINVWVPENLWKHVEALGHDSPTKATIAAFEALAFKEEEGINKEEIGRNQETRIHELGKQVEETQRQIRNQEEKLKVAPDLREFSRLQARVE